MTEQTKDKPRSDKDALHALIKRLPHEDQKRVREVLKSKGVLKDDEPDKAHGSV